MKPEVEALLGGYSAGTLTKEEDLRLVQAALEDQEVFDATHTVEQTVAGYSAKTVEELAGSVTPQAA